MAISFDSIPSNLRVPFVAVEFDASRASQGPALLAYRAILIGQKLSTGTALPNTMVRATGPDHAAVLAGRGSILHRMAVAWFASNRFTELWLGILDDVGGGTAATGTITVTATAAAAGTIALYVGGVRVPVPIATGAAANAIATAIVAEVNARPDLPVTAAATGGVVTLTFRNRGTVGSSYDVRHSYRDGEALPPGVTLAFAPLSGGASNPSLASLIAAIGDAWFQVWAHPYADSASLAVFEAELSRRFGPMVAMDGIAITSASGTFSALSTLGGARNSQHSVIVSQPGANPLTPPMEFAAEIAAIAARFGAIDPARPFQTLPMVNALPPAEIDLFSLEERNLLLFDGIATTRTATGGTVQVERLITTYQRNPSGSDDVAYLDVTTMLTLLYLRYSFRTQIQSRYPRHKLADDGTGFGPGQLVITPKDGRGEALGWFDEMQQLGLVEGAEQFERDLVVERNPLDRNRMDWLLSPDLINQLVVGAAKVLFRL